MNRNIAATILFCGLSLVTANALAAPAIVVGNLSIATGGVTTFDVPYDPSSGGGSMQGQTLYISIADEGNGAGGLADFGEPKIVNIDTVTGTNWAPNVIPPVMPFVSDQFWQIDQVTLSGTVSASGKAFSITIDFTGVPLFSIWALRAVSVDVPSLGGPYYSEWFASPRTPFEGSNGTFQPVPVPEPSPVVLTAFAFVGLAAWGWRGLLAAAGLGIVALRKRRAHRVA